MWYSAEYTSEGSSFRVHYCFAAKVRLEGRASECMSRYYISTSVRFLDSSSFHVETPFFVVLEVFSYFFLMGKRRITVTLLVKQVRHSYVCSLLIHLTFIRNFHIFAIKLSTVAILQRIFDNFVSKLLQ